MRASRALYALGLKDGPAVTPSMVMSAAVTPFPTAVAMSVLISGSAASKVVVEYPAMLMLMVTWLPAGVLGAGPGPAGGTGPGAADGPDFQLTALRIAAATASGEYAAYFVRRMYMVLVGRKLSSGSVSTASLQISVGAAASRLHGLLQGRHKMLVAFFF